MSTERVVFVSGATGFIAQHVVKQLVGAGYRTIGSVRSEEKGQDLKSLIKGAGLKSDLFNYIVVKDIAAKGAFDDALKAHPEITDFLHTASPFHFEITDIKKDLLDPAVEGTNNALNAIEAYGKNIRRVVVTSSYAAIGGWGQHATPGKYFTEASWNPITWEESLDNPFFGYLGSKKFAEKAAWDFVKEHKPQWTLTTVNPSYVLGPQAFEVKDKSKLNTSNEVINTLLTSGKNKSEPQQYAGNYIDVRDVAKAHLYGFEKGNTAGQRLFVSEGTFVSIDILKIIEKDFPQLKSSLPTLDTSKALKVEELEGIINNEKTKQILGFKFIGLEKIVDDTVAQLI